MAAQVGSWLHGLHAASATFLIGRLAGVARPGIASIYPTGHVILDVGANLECKPDHLLQFAVMGAALAQVYLHKDDPTVGLINIGEGRVGCRRDVMTCKKILGKGLRAFQLRGLLCWTKAQQACFIKGIHHAGRTNGEQADLDARGLADRVLRGLSVEPVKDTELVQLSYVGSSAEMSARTGKVESDSASRSTAGRGTD